MQNPTSFPDPGPPYFNVLHAIRVSNDGLVTLKVLETVRPKGILGAGHHIATDSQGHLYVAATGAGMQKLTFRGMSGAQ